jgi:hypothetical protein
MIFTPQTWYCNACGKKQSSPPSSAVGRDYKCCSTTCHGEMEWRETLSIMGRVYHLRHQNTESEVTF